MTQNKIHIIAGPTASGKSARAIELATAANGVILNADATQCYADLQILSARPSAEELAQADHRLYGIWSGDKVASVGDWLSMLKPEIEQCWTENKLPIVCGGTGFYLKALMEGLSPIPDIAPEIRAEITRETESDGNSSIYEKLSRVDPKVVKNIPPANTQRMIRAYEVYLGTGKPMSEWQAMPKEPPFPQATFELDIIELPRKELYERCDTRFESMLAAGALDEVKGLLAKKYAPDVPVMKAVGVAELASHLAGELSIEEAGALSKQNTRHYAKRQLTWLRNQF
ncbi:MAG: tRNA (adenosine(37)-N6)-dimethylallyltransferase MiaA [Rickettsiales bacterium]|nr:tRNA (adenosine(37)-N6)-dimethylallyltransferase MiaA [Rickettsiales bacterium]